MEKVIEKHRMGTLMIEAAPGARVVVEQLRHEFWFGAAISSGMFGWRAKEQDAAKYKDTFLANFNAAVTENALKWSPMERQRGKVEYRVVDAILRWADRHEIPIRGHCIFWGVPQFVQDWVKKLTDDELHETIKNRAIDIGQRYRGRFVEYDLNNEMIHKNYYEERLGPDITKQMAQWVREGDPDAVLFVNDYDILTGRRLKDYIAHIRGLLDQGVPVGGIGVQGHLHGESFDAEALRNALDELAKLGLPIRITEFNFPGQRSRFFKDKKLRLTSEEEKAKAKALVDYYRICFAHPAVEGILMWGFWEGACWIPASALYKRDWTATPAAEAYRDLVFREWWTTWEGRADEKGQCTVRAFYGRHRVTVDGADKIVELRKADGTKIVSFN
jgi:GH35 family endo-1,4-beta-xylanase